MAFGYYNCRLDVVIIVAKFTKICIQAMREVLMQAEINLISPMCKHIEFPPPAPRSLFRALCQSYKIF